MDLEDLEVRITIGLLARLLALEASLVLYEDRSEAIIVERGHILLEILPKEVVVDGYSEPWHGVLTWFDELCVAEERSIAAMALDSEE